MIRNHWLQNYRISHRSPRQLGRKNVGFFDDRWVRKQIGRLGHQRCGDVAGETGVAARLAGNAAIALQCQRTPVTALVTKNPMAADTAVTTAPQARSSNAIGQVQYFNVARLVRS